MTFLSLLVHLLSSVDDIDDNLILKDWCRLFFFLSFSLLYDVHHQSFSSFIEWLPHVLFLDFSAYFDETAVSLIGSRHFLRTHFPELFLDIRNLKARRQEKIGSAGQEVYHVSLLDFLLLILSWRIPFLLKGFVCLCNQDSITAQEPSKHSLPSSLISSTASFFLEMMIRWPQEVKCLLWRWWWLWCNPSFVIIIRIRFIHEPIDSQVPVVFDIHGSFQESHYVSLLFISLPIFVVIEFGFYFEWWETRNRLKQTR